MMGGRKGIKDAGGDVRSLFYTDFDKLARASNSNSNSNSYRNTGNKHGACDPRAFGSRGNTPDIDTSRSRRNNNTDILDDNDNYDDSTD